MITFEEYEAAVPRAAIEGFTLAAAGYGSGGTFQAHTLYRAFPYLGGVSLDMDWSWSRDDLTFTGNERKGRLGTSVSTSVPHNLDCFQILESGSVSATTSHEAHWTLYVLGMPGSLLQAITEVHLDLNDETSDSETCPPPEVDGYTEVKSSTGGGGGGGDESDGDEYEEMCMVYVTYYVHTGQIKDIDVLYCW